MILSGAFLGDLREVEAMKIGQELDKLGFSGSDSCEEPIHTRWQLDLTVDLKAGFEGTHNSADMDTYVRNDRIQHGTKTSLRTQDADEFPWRTTFSHAQGAWQSSSDKVWCSCVQTLGWPKINK